MLDLDLKSPHKEDSDDYWHEYGQRAKQQGWQIVERSVSPPEGMGQTVDCSNSQPQRPRPS
jgi:hypothetical protein